MGERGNENLAAETEMYGENRRKVKELQAQGWKSIGEIWVICQGICDRFDSKCSYDMIAARVKFYSSQRPEGIKTFTIRSGAKGGITLVDKAIADMIIREMEVIPTTPKPGWKPFSTIKEELPTRARSGRLKVIIDQLAKEHPQWIEVCTREVKGSHRKIKYYLAPVCIW